MERGVELAQDLRDRRCGPVGAAEVELAESSDAVANAGLQVRAAPAANGRGPETGDVPAEARAEVETGRESRRVLGRQRTPPRAAAGERAPERVVRVRRGARIADEARELLAGEVIGCAVERVPEAVELVVDRAAGERRRAMSDPDDAAPTRVAERCAPAREAAENASDEIAPAARARGLRHDLVELPARD